jgi:hypothetical protein
MIICDAMKPAAMATFLSSGALAASREGTRFDVADLVGDGENATTALIRRHRRRAAIFISTCDEGNH